jgi:hypothetical protein
VIPGIVAGGPVASGPPPGGFPVLEGQSYGVWTSAITNQDVAVPAGVTAGDLLVFVLLYGANVAQPTSAGVSPLIEQYDAAGSDYNGFVMTKVSDGTETTVTFVTGGATGGYICYRISGAASVEAAGSNLFAGSNQACPPLSPSWGAADTLWLANASFYFSPTGGGVGALTSYPFPDNQVYQNAGADGRAGNLATCTAETNTATKTPAAWTYAFGGQYGVGFTIGIEPI